MVSRKLADWLLINWEKNTADPTAAIFFYEDHDAQDKVNAVTV